MLPPPFITGPFVQWRMLNLIRRAPLGKIHHHRFNFPVNAQELNKRISKNQSHANNLYYRPLGSPALLSDADLADFAAAHSGGIDVT